MEQTERVKVKKASKTKHRVKSNNDASQIFRRHISESHWTIKNWYRHLHWRNIFYAIIVPVAAVLITLHEDVPLTRNGVYLFIAYSLLSSLGIRIGYHRYFSHRTFRTGPLMQFAFVFFGAGAGIGSAKWWCSAHRAHHRYCDTERDPHNIRKGFWYSHIGWLILRLRPKVQASIRQSESDDLQSNQFVKWQYENYFRIFLCSGLLLPAITGKVLFNDFYGGFLYGGLWKVVFVQQTTSLTTSLTHMVGSQPFDDTKSPRNNFFFSLLTFGEGNQNFHHEFPFDYRLGHNLWDFDPSKWALYLLSLFGVVHSLQTAPNQAIAQLRLQQEQKIIDQIRSRLNWGIPIEKLPVISSADFVRMAKECAPERALVVVSGIVHDVSPFLSDHPGGVHLIKASIGKDATGAFNGAVYAHSNAAHNLLATMRIAVLKGSSEQDVWKQEQRENKEIPLKNDSEGKKIVRSGEQATMSVSHSTTAGAA